jgi:hypothetical protein
MFLKFVSFNLIEMGGSGLHSNVGISEIRPDEKLLSGIAIKEVVSSSNGNIVEEYYRYCPLESMSDDAAVSLNIA